MNDEPTRPIVIRLGTTGESFEFDPPDDLWFSMLAFCKVKGITLQTLIAQSLARFFADWDGQTNELRRMWGRDGR